MATVDSFQLLYSEISRSCSFYYETLALVGALYAGSKALILIKECCTLVRVHFLPRMIPTKRLTQQFGDWAVIYGASQPVAEAYAEELAKRGVSIIFVSQEDMSSVRDAASSLSQNYGVETAVVLVDFCLDQEACKPIKDAIRDKDVGFLVNCVDESLLLAHDVAVMSERGALEAVHKNVTVATLMVRLVLPGMLERSRGAVVNISSAACRQALPGRVLLTAAAGYLDQLSRALHHQYSDKGIFVQSLIPLQIASSERQPSTSRTATSRPGFFNPSPEVYAHHAISTLGISSRTSGYWPHTLQCGLMSCIPEWIWVLGSRTVISSR